MKTTTGKAILILLAAVFALHVNSCHTSGEKRKDNQVTLVENGKIKGYAGNLIAGVDESIADIARLQAEVFEYEYESVNLTLKEYNSNELLSSFRKHETTIILTTRQLSDNERDEIKRMDSILVREVIIAYDAIAMIVHKDYQGETPDSAALRSYFTANKSSGSPALVFDNEKSGSAAFILDKFKIKENTSGNIYALKNTDEVIGYIQSNKNAIGFVPYNVISDMDDPSVQKTLEQVKVLGIKTLNEKGEPVIATANQSDIAAGYYLLKRTIIALMPFRYSDSLEWLWVSFLSKEKGARIFLKAGFVPYKIPEREIIVNMQPVSQKD